MVLGGNPVISHLQKAWRINYFILNPTILLNNYFSLCSTDQSRRAVIEREGWHMDENYKLKVDIYLDISTLDTVHLRRKRKKIRLLYLVLFQRGKEWQIFLLNI